MKMKMEMFRYVAAAVATMSCWPGGAECNSEINGRLNHEMPDVDMPAGDTIGIPLRDHYNLPAGCVESAREDGIVIFEATSSDPAVAVWIADDYETLVVAALEAADADSARVTVYSPIAAWGYEFLVRVAAR